MRSKTGREAHARDRYVLPLPTPEDRAHRTGIIPLVVRPHYTRVAVAQLDFVPAAVIHRRSPLEEPLFELGAPDSLLPEGGSFPRELHDALEQLRGRVRATYAEQYWLKLQAVVAACRRWNVKLLVLPEYSVPWELLPRLAAAADEMVVVAGTHAVERGGLRARVYEQLGWAYPVVGGTAVAPVLYDGRLIALQPKLSAAAAEQGSLKLGEVWEPIDTEGADGPGITGPMGVMICLDFLFRERGTHRDQVGPHLDQARFLAVPSYTPWHTLDEFAAKAREEARRYGRPVLYANVASQGGSSLFVDEGQLADLSGFPDHVGYLGRGDEGVIVADVDLGYQSTGRSTRYEPGTVVRPVAAASLVYRDRTLSDRYAQWSLSFAERLEQLDVSDALDELAEQRDLLLDSGSLEGVKVRKARLDRMFLNLKYISDRTDLQRFLAEVVLPPDVLPLALVRAALASGALEIVRMWAVKHRFAGFEAVEKRLLVGAKPAREYSDRTESGVAAIASIGSTVRGEVQPQRVEVPPTPASKVPSDVALQSVSGLSIRGPDADAVNMVEPELFGPGSSGHIDAYLQRQRQRLDQIGVDDYVIAAREQAFKWPILYERPDAHRLDPFTERSSEMPTPATSARRLLAVDGDRAVLVAGAGFGKTALLESIARELGSSAKVPVFVPLAAYGPQAKQSALSSYLPLSFEHDEDRRLPWSELAAEGAARAVVRRSRRDAREAAYSSDR